MNWIIPGLFIATFVLVMTYVHLCQYWPWRRMRVAADIDPNLLEVSVVGVVAAEGTKLVWGIEDPRRQKVFFLVRLHENFNDENSRAYKYFRYYFITDGIVCYNVERKTEQRRSIVKRRARTDVPDRDSEFVVEVRPFFFSIPRNWFDGIIKACAEFSTQLEGQQCSKIGA